jgi:mono/diheme cytochrome c family protein
VSGVVERFEGRVGKGFAGELGKGFEGGSGRRHPRGAARPGVRWEFGLLAIVLAAGAAGCSPQGTSAPGADVPQTRLQGASAPESGVPGAELPSDRPDELLERVLRGRDLVIGWDCGACHGGNPNPASEQWLAGRSAEGAADRIGPYRFWARNLTPDEETGIGRYSERQLFNSLRYGLRPASTPDVDIVSAVPGEGGHPLEPDYLAPGMPWTSWRYLPDEDLRAIAAYLKHGVRPVRHRVPDPEAPPDRWASEYTVERIGTHVLPPFPTRAEALPDPERREAVLRGRELAASMACGACHGGALHPGQEGWMIGMTGPEQEYSVLGFATRPRNLTPDNLTGLGRFSERQIFNALRYGLRPGETADVEITSSVRGEGGHPMHAKYLAPPMPWPAWRHLPDEDVWAIVAYLTEGLRPVSHRVADSEGPPDFWASASTPEVIGTYPAPPFPTARERWPR